MFIAKLIHSIFLVGIGILILKYRRNVKSWTGNFGWAENYLGRGSTNFVIALIGLILIFYGFLYPFGGINFLIGNK